ncbi:hypothetical protein EDB89DRAFT_1649475 [Lactarius sanguifluus]|nr:hypothetical protein EDB89DRAFT_1649475 [Lactarius sanguifluus]
MLQNFITGQKNSPIWNGRPSTNCGIPIQLYRPSFAKFLRISHGDAVGIELKPETYSATHSLFHLSAALYSNEDKRVAATRTPLGLGPNIMITEDQHIFLVDFNWCRGHEKDTYPVLLNDNRHTPNSIDWHPDVKRRGRMAKEHETSIGHHAFAQPATSHNFKSRYRTHPTRKTQNASL